jgi:mycothiol synthase
MGNYPLIIYLIQPTMTLDDIQILPADPAAHFAGIATLMNTVESEPNTAESLDEWYQKQLADGVSFAVAQDRSGCMLGFNGIYRANTNIERYFAIYLVVNQDYWNQGIGTMLYANLLTQASALDALTLRVRVRDNCQPGIRFAQKHGFVQKKHSIEMMLDLDTWDDTKFTPIIESLQARGFHFTNMAELGNSLEARRKLFDLNNRAAATDPGSDGIPPWGTFEEFDQDVCGSSWYHPDAQFVAIDTHTGEWAAMSAITVFSEADHAYNLFTGTDVKYRGRKLAQAVKSLALRRARLFGVHTVRTNHNSENEAMIAIDKKLGYGYTPGMLIMEKELQNG